MNPRHVPSVVLSVCVVALLCWFFWPKEAPNPGAEPAVAGESPEFVTMVATTEPQEDAPVDPSAFSQLDPATLQAALAAIEQLQQQEQARMDKTVMNNLRQLSQGADQFFIERGASSVASADLVGTNSSQYVKTFTPVAGETYPVVIIRDQPLTASGVEGTRDITLEGSALRRDLPYAP